MGGTVGGDEEGDAVIMASGEGRTIRSGVLPADGQVAGSQIIKAVLVLTLHPPLLTVVDLDQVPHRRTI